MSRTVTFIDRTATGLRWECSISEPTKIRDWNEQRNTRGAVDLARRFRRAGWDVVVLGDAPGATVLRSV